MGNSYAIEVHIRMDGELSLHDAHRITSSVEDGLKRRFGENTIVTIHSEPIQSEPRNWSVAMNFIYLMGILHPIGGELRL